MHALNQKLYLDGSLLIDSKVGLTMPWSYIFAYGGSFLKMGDNPTIEVQGIMKHDETDPTTFIYDFKTVKRAIVDPFDEAMIMNYRYN